MNENMRIASKTLRTSKKLMGAATVFSAARMIALSGAAATLAAGGVRLFSAINKK